MKPQLIESIKDPAFEELRRSRTKVGREQHHTFVIENEEMIEEALKAGFTMKALYSTSPDYLKKKEGAFQVSHGMMTKVFGNETPSAAALAYKKEADLDSFNGKRLVLVLDRIQNCNNMGMIFRSAEAFGVEGIIIIPHPTADLYDRNSIKASMGSFFRLPMTLSSTEETLAFLKENGTHILSTSLEARETLESAKWKKPVALIVGNETDGIDPAFLKASHSVVSIPMQGQIQSLNVVVAASICLYHLSNQGCSS